MGRVLISAGHTQTDPGDVYGDLREADITRKIAKYVGTELRSSKVPLLSVPLDLPLVERIEWINNSGYSEEKGDVCVEIHINSGGHRGIESWYRGEGNNRSSELAQSLVDEVCKITGYTNLGAKSEFEHELGSLTFLRRTNPTTVIIETLFIDQNEDIAILKDEARLGKLGKAIATAIKSFLGFAHENLPHR